MSRANQTTHFLNFRSRIQSSEWASQRLQLWLIVHQLIVASVLQMTNDQQSGLRQSQVHALFKLLGLDLCQICYTIERGEF